jgi:hypothetical protein
VLYVKFQSKGRDIVEYSLVLVVGAPEEPETVRVYDSAHGFNEMHRFIKEDGKQRGVAFHAGTLGEGMRMAIKSIKSGFQQMIEGWEGR